MSQTRGVRVLVTSQAPLGVAGEHVYRLTALSVPDAASPVVDAAAFPALEPICVPELAFDVGDLAGLRSVARSLHPRGYSNSEASPSAAQ